jgi:hypothetical protein
MFAVYIQNVRGVGCGAGEVWRASISSTKCKLPKHTTDSTDMMSMTRSGRGKPWLLHSLHVPASTTNYKPHG